MSLDNDLRKLLVAAVQGAPASDLPAVYAALIGVGGVPERRREPRTKNGTSRAARGRRTCPVAGCKNAFAPRYGGYCEVHRNTKGFKDWEVARTAKGRKKAAKKR